MTKNDYIEKITQNLEHLTKDELKDVAILTNAQFGVRLKVAEKEYWGKEIANLKSQLQQQALPVVPEDVDKAIKYLKKHNNSTWSDLGGILTEKGFSWLNDFQFKDRRFGVGGLNDKLFILSHLAITGYQVEKPQLFYIDLPKVFGLSDSTFVSKAESGIISEFTKGKDYALKLTEQEIKSIDERYWQFAVPVEDGE